MRKRKKIPCKQCPWRTDSLQGYLGGHEPEYYADTVVNNEVPTCHMNEYGMSSPDSQLCAGALATAANACIAPYNEPEGMQARDQVGKRDDCFEHPKQFYEYHAGREYVHFVMRGDADSVEATSEGD